MSRSLERVRVTRGGVEGPWRMEGLKGVVGMGWEDGGGTCSFGLDIFGEGCGLTGL